MLPFFHKHTWLISRVLISPKPGTDYHSWDFAITYICAASSHANHFEVVADTYPAAAVEATLDALRFIVSRPPL